MLARDGMRLPVLSSSLRRNDHRTLEGFWNKNLPGVGRTPTFRSYGELSCSWMGAASPCIRTSRAVVENLADPCGKSIVEPIPVFRPAFGVHGSPLLFPLRDSLVWAR